LTGADQVSWMDRLEAEHDNFRAALSRSLEAGDAELALRIGAPCGASGTSGATLARVGTGWEQVWQGDGPLLLASGARRRLIWGTWS
jgi:hypothetical protein